MSACSGRRQCAESRCRLAAIRCHRAESRVGLQRTEVSLPAPPAVARKSKKREPGAWCARHSRESTDLRCGRYRDLRGLDRAALRSRRGTSVQRREPAARLAGPRPLQREWKSLRHPLAEKTAQRLPIGRGAPRGRSRRSRGEPIRALPRRDIEDRFEPRTLPRSLSNLVPEGLWHVAQGFIPGIRGGVSLPHPGLKPGATCLRPQGARGRSTKSAPCFGAFRPPGRGQAPPLLWINACTQVNAYGVRG